MSPFAALLLGVALLGYCVDLGSTETDPDWMTEAIERHNLYRKGFNAPPLVLNHNLCNASQSWANKLAEVGGEVKQSPDVTYGENLYALSGDDIQVYGSTPVDAWYDEIKHYDFDVSNGLVINQSAPKDVGIGSFTQLIWKSSREMCISYATSQNPGDNHGVNVYVVAVYYPPGNDKELEEENITPLLDSAVFFPDSSRAPVPVHLSDPVGSDEHLKSKISIPSDVPESVQDSIGFEPVSFDIETPGNSTNTNRIEAKEDHEHERIKVDLCPKRNDEAIGTTNAYWILSALNRANEYRKKHSSQPLILNHQLCNISQAWSNELAKRDELLSSRSGCGENLYVFEDGKIGEPEEPIDAWYKEIDNYDFKHSVSKQGDPVANFTQLLWRGSSSMCITMATTKDNLRTYVVATFHPQGNVPKKYPDNVAREYSDAGMLKGLSLTSIGLVAFFATQFY